jgi:hypothetical protein
MSWPRASRIVLLLCLGCSEPEAERPAPPAPITAAACFSEGSTCRELIDFGPTSPLHLGEAAIRESCVYGRVALREHCPEADRVGRCDGTASDAIVYYGPTFTRETAEQDCASLGAGFRFTP